jgi:hypothetical protein
MITLKAELFQDLNGTVKGLQSALQNAVELEHATIPPYLYALCSIRQNTNAEIACLIKSVVAEEMLHMAIDCNILNWVLILCNMLSSPAVPASLAVTS